MKEGRVMESIGGIFQQYATTEVFTVFAALITGWLGWKAASKTTSVLKGFAQKIGFGGLVSSILLCSGFGAISLGIGELVSRSPKKIESNKNLNSQLTNKQLVVMSNQQGSNENISEILKYATERDKMVNRINNGVFVDHKNRKWVLQDSDIKTSDDDFVKTFHQTAYNDLPFKVEEQPTIKNEESIMTLPMACSSIGIGTALIIISSGIFLSPQFMKS